MRRWVWIWEVGVGGVGRCGCDVGRCGRWVQVMERVKIEGVEREGVWKRVSSHTHIGMLHRST